MLRTADNFADGVGEGDLAPRDSTQSSGSDVVTAPAATAYVPAGGRYGEGRRFSLPATIVTIGIHGLLLVGLLGLQYRAEAKKDVKLVTVNLTPDAPPPPPSEAEKVPETVRSPIVAPPPMIDIPRPAPPMAVSPEPVPLPPVQAPAAPAPTPPAPPAPPSVIKSDDLGARMISGKPPRYPVESRRKHEQGTVLLSLIVGVDGAVTEISIAHSSGFARLDDAARDAVRRWRWAPITQGGRPVMVRGVVEIPFVLQG